MFSQRSTTPLGCVHRRPSSSRGAAGLPQQHRRVETVVGCIPALIIDSARKPVTAGLVLCHPSVMTTDQIQRVHSPCAADDLNNRMVRGSRKGNRQNQWPCLRGMSYERQATPTYRVIPGRVESRLSVAAAGGATFFGG